MPLDTSALRSIDTSAAPPPLDTSSLTAVNGNSAPQLPSDAPDAPASYAGVAQQFGWGIAKGIPSLVKMAGNIASNPLGVKEAALSDDRPSDAAAFDKFIVAKYGPPDAARPNGWSDETRQKAWVEFQQSGGGNQRAPSPGLGDAIDAGLSAIRINPKDYAPEPKNAPERVAEAIGEGAIQMVVPGLGEVSIPKIIADALVGAVSSGGAQAAAEVAPKWLKPYAGIVAGMLLGTGASVGAGLAGVGTRAAIEYGVRPIRAGLGNEAATQKIAGKILTDAAEDPNAAIKAIDAAPEHVSGSKPTLFQATGDAGLGTLSGVIERENPAPFIERYGEQNAARVKALTDIQSQGHPEAVADYLRAQLSDIDQRTQAAYDTAAADLAAKQGTGQPAAIVGDSVRQKLQEARDSAEAETDALWKAVDPNKEAVVVSGPIKRAKDAIYAKMSPEEAIGLTANEKALADVIGTYGATLPLDRLIRLRSRVSTDMRAAQSPMTPNSEAYGRLSRLRGAIEDAISDSIAGKAADQQRAVAAGMLSPEETLAANLNRQLEAWRAQRSQAVGAGGEGGTGATAGTGSAGGAGVSGTMRETGSGPLRPEGTQGVSRQPYLSADAAGRLKEATAATKAQKTTFGAKPVAQILKRPGETYPYTMQDGSVADAAFASGAKGGDSVRLILAANSSPEMTQALTDAAAQSLRSKGELTPRKLEAWQAQHSDALDALEEVVPGTRAHFENIGAAATHLEDVAAIRRDALEEAQSGKLRQIMGVTDPEDVTKTVGGILGAKDSVRQMDRLVTEVGNDPMAREGLRKALVDTIMAKAQSTAEAGVSGIEKLKPDTFIRFLNQNEPALSKVFTPEEIASMRGVAEDLKRAGRTVQTTPGSVTAQWRHAAEKFGSQEPHDMFTMLWQALRAPTGIGTAIGLVTANPVVGGAAAALSFALGHLRRAGIRNAQDLVRQAMLDPQFAKVLMMKAPKRIEAGAMQAFSRRLAKMSIVTGLNAE